MRYAWDSQQGSTWLLRDEFQDLGEDFFVFVLINCIHFNKYPFIIMHNGENNFWTIIYIREDGRAAWVGKSGLEPGILRTTALYAIEFGSQLYNAVSSWCND